MAEPFEKGSRFQGFLSRRKRAGRDAADARFGEPAASELDEEPVEEEVKRPLIEKEEDIIEEKEGPLPRLTRQIPLALGEWAEKRAPVKLKREEEAGVNLELEEQEGIDDPVRMYLREIGKVHLLTAQDEKRLARQMEDGKHVQRLEKNWQEVNGFPPTAVDVMVALLEEVHGLSPVKDVVVKALGLKGLPWLVSLANPPSARPWTDRSTRS